MGRAKMLLSGSRKAVRRVGHTIMEGLEPRVLLSAGNYSRGVDMSGLEFNSGTLPGVCYTNYTANSDASYNYFGNKGLTLIRVPFLWERVQPTLNGALDTTYLGYITNNVNWAKAHGCKVILDVHDYGAYRGGGIDVSGSGVTTANLSDLWTKLSTYYKGNTGVYAYDLMNEPAYAGNWHSTSQAVLTAIRNNGDNTLIMVPGSGWESAGSYSGDNGSPWITDPAHNFKYSAHMYFDHDNSGTYGWTYDQELANNSNLAQIGVQRLDVFKNWCVSNGVDGYIGEFGCPGADSRWMPVLNNFYNDLDSAGFDGTYWAAGEWWGSYPLSCQPSSNFTVDAPQIATMVAHLGKTLGTTASVVATDTTVQGNWKSAYGKDGYNVIGDSSSYPSYASVTASGNNSYVWSSSMPSSVQALQKGSNPSDRIAGCWYSSSTMDVTVSVTGGMRQVALYFLDWDTQGRSETVDAYDASTGSTLAAQQTVSGFAGGKYLVYNISGNVRFHFTNKGPANAVLSGIFFGGAEAASFVGADTTTQGSWQGKYGSEGYNVIDDSSSYPAYASVTVTGNSNCVWSASSPTAVQALQKGTNVNDRIAACWYSSGSMDVTVGATAGSHQVALYFLDWDAQSRAETVDVYDASSGATLAPEQTVSAFTGGKYLMYNMSGNVRFHITKTAGANAVLSGIFFGSHQTVANFALNKTVTASSSYEGSGWSTVKLVDGQESAVSNAYGWSSSSNLSVNHTEWAQVDMGVAVNGISEVDLWPRNDGGNAGAGFPIDFTVQVSNDSTFTTGVTTVVSQTGYPAPTTGADQRFTFGAVSGRYVRVTGTNLSRIAGESGQPYRMQLAELEVWANTQQAPALANASFESPAQNGGYSMDPTGAGWTFTGNAGLEGNGSTYGAANAPDGVQAAILQSAGAGGTNQNGQISQVLNFATTGTFTLRFNVARRSYSPGGTQSVGVYLDGVLVQSFTPSSSSGWDTDQVALNIAATGNHTIMFAAMNSSGDQTAFLDNVRWV